MVWFKVDDSLYDHPKWIDLSANAQALWLNSGSWAGRSLTDGWVSPTFVKRYPSWSRSAKELVRVTLWHPDAERDEKVGWQFHDWHKYQPTAKSVKLRQEADRNRQQLARDKALRDAIRRRDGDLCRYCRRVVKWTDRSGPGGGTYDHVDPKAGTSFPNCVVSCRGCNGYKQHRTPAQAGMTLLPPGGPGASSGANSGASSDPGAEGVTPLTPKVGTGRGGTGRVRTGPDGLDDGASSVGLPEHSWNPADYDHADLSPPPRASPPTGALLDPYEDIPLPGLDDEPPHDPHEHPHDL